MLVGEIILGYWMAFHFLSWKKINLTFYYFLCIIHKLSSYFIF